MSHNLTTIGTCSICGGPVKVPNLWMGVIPPTPTCANCGAIEAENGPVIPMIKPEITYNRTGNNHLKYNGYSTSKC